MAIFKTLIKTLTRTYTTKPRVNLFTSSTLTIPTTLTSLKTPFLPAPHFLSSPPWKLCQSAISVHLQSDALLFHNEVKAFDSIRLSFGQELSRNPALFPNSSQQVSRKPTLLSNLVNSENSSNGDDEVFRDSFVNLPNFVSMSRLVSGPVLGWMIIEGWYLPAFLGLAVSGATDWLDGYIARKMNINSVVGSYLDPLADKVLIGCVAVAMVHNDLLHPGLVGIVVLRDVGLVCGAIYKRASDLDWKWKTWRDFLNLNGTSPQKVEPLFISKVNTVVQLGLVAGALLQPDLGTDQTQSYITYLSWLVASTTAASTAAYGAQHLRLKSASSIRNH